jgi:phosphoribosylaminoimidazolecarboxamide formyltransferase/IMP cyclohydrolase
VDNKIELINFVSSLSEHGYEIIASNDTGEYLKENGIAVSVADEATDGEQIHKAILADRSEVNDVNSLLENNIDPIDIVVVNFSVSKDVLKSDVDVYSLVKQFHFFDNLVLRSGVRNFKDVAVVTDCGDYENVINEITNLGEVSKETKVTLCQKAIDYLCKYETVTADCFRSKVSTFAYPEIFNTAYDKVAEIADGENCLSTAALYRSSLSDSKGLCDLNPLIRGDLSFDNYKDIDFAVELAKEFKEQCVAVIAKHSTVCGVAIGEKVNEAFVKASRTDSVSNSGAVVVLNGAVDKMTALEIIKNPYSVVIAPEFEQEAIDICLTKENLNVFSYDLSEDDRITRKYQVFKIHGGLLMRNVNNISVTVNECQCVTNQRPEEQQISDLMAGFKIVKKVPCEAVIAFKDGQTVGVSSGQTNKITACKNALLQAGNKAEKATVAFTGAIHTEEIINLCAEFKISAIIQTGGISKDQEIIDLCNEKEIAMLFVNAN